MLLLAYVPLSDSDVQVFDAASIPAHIEKVEIVDADVEAAIIPLACPEVCRRIRLQNIANLNERLSKAELIDAGEIRRLRGVGLNKHRSMLLLEVARLRMHSRQKNKKPTLDQCACGGWACNICDGGTPPQ